MRRLHHFALDPFSRKLRVLLREKNLAFDLVDERPGERREELLHLNPSGEVPVLVVSKIANFAIDLPEAAVAVQMSGTFGSRQEEAQRLGRITRPKHDGRQAHFYAIVSRDTIDTEYAAHRQRFLAEQGYAYRIVDADDLLGPALPDIPA